MSWVAWLICPEKGGKFMQYKTLKAIARFLFKHFTHIEVIGMENVPPTGGLILAANHLSRLDPPLVFAVVGRDDVTALVADKYIHNPFFNWMINGVHGIWINRESADFRALRVARDYLQQGGALGVAPEGTRSRTHALIQGKTGVAYLADRAGVPVVPVAITGTESAVSTFFHLRRPHIRIRFGEPFCLQPSERHARGASLEHNTDEIMCRIAALLPPEYRGVYAVHPRLQELLRD
jgi:1-acyl-sn-glycerol-3-phosphate acyltransferase